MTKLFLSILLAAQVNIHSPAIASEAPRQRLISDISALTPETHIHSLLRPNNLPSWAIIALTRAYQVYQTYKNGQAVEAMRVEINAILKLVEEARDARNNPAALAAIQELIATHHQALDLLVVAVEALNEKVSHPTCKPRFARRNGVCVDVADHPKAW